MSWLLLGLIIVLSSVPPGLRPVSGAPSLSEHAAIFLLTGIAFAVGYRVSTGLFLCLAVAFSAAIEVLQLFVPGRHARLSDFLVDALAACMGLGLGLLAAPRIAR